MARTPLNLNPLVICRALFCRFPRDLVIWRSDVFPKVLFHKVLYALKSGFSAQRFTREPWAHLPQDRLRCKMSCAEASLSRFAFGKPPGCRLLWEPAACLQISIWGWETPNNDCSMTELNYPAKRFWLGQWLQQQKSLVLLKIILVTTKNLKCF